MQVDAVIAFNFSCLMESNQICSVEKLVLSVTGRCTENSNVTFVDGGHTVAQKGQEEMFCQLENNSGDLCVDLGGGNPNTGSPLIAWECSGQWNQLFRLVIILI